MRLIDADALKESLKELEAESNSIRYTQGLQDAVDYYFPQIIDDAPTIDAVPVKHGRWIQRRNGQYYCNNCGREERFIYQKNCCPKCGAKMDGSEGQ